MIIAQNRSEVYLEALGGKICSLKEMPGPNLKWRKRFIIKIHSKCCISVTQDTLTCDFYIVKQIILREEITLNLKLFMLTHFHFSAISRIFKVHFQIHLFLTIQFHMISGFPVLWLQSLCLSIEITVGLCSCTACNVFTLSCMRVFGETRVTDVRPSLQAGFTWP